MEFSLPERIANGFKRGLEALNNDDIPYVVGGAFAIHHYTEIWRNTHDLDVYVERSHVPAAIGALDRAGFRDYGEMAAGDREWIYHAMRNRVLIDVIWQPPNHLTPVDESYYWRGGEGEFLGIQLRFIPPDELAWSKLFTMNRHRCDWPDLFNLVRARPPTMDWQHLIGRMGEHWQVLLAFVTLFDWTYPGDRQCVPEDIREELFRRQSDPPTPVDHPSRESILDPWIYTRPLSV